MTAQKKVYKVGYCKRAKFQTTNGQTLQQLVSHALAERNLASHRCETLDSDDRFRLINDFSDQRGVLCGVMLTYERGTDALALSEDDDATTYTVERFAPPVNEKGKRREFLNGLLYFAIASNNVAIIQSQGLRSAEFETHISWLLHGTGGIPHDSLFALPDAISTKIEQRIKSKHVKEVLLGTPLVEVSDVDGPSVNTTAKENKTLTLDLGGLALKFLDQLKGIMPKDEFKAALGDDIELSLRIRHIGSGVSAPGQELIDKLAMVLRNQDGADTVIKLNNGEQIRGDALKLSKKFYLPALNGIVLPLEAYDELASWLRELISSGLINP